MGSYKSEYPSGLEFDSSYKQFFEQFYKLSDTPDAHEEYAKQFTKDATFIMASKTMQGSSEILNMRKSMWEKVSSRAHHPTKIFPFGSESNEVMLYGTVDYGFKAGGKASKDWAARAHMVKEDGVVKMSLYQVYLDTAA